MPGAYLNFAYGSNMASARIRARVPSARAVGVARLAGHELRWHKRGRDGSGKCDVVAGAGSVWGVVYEIDAAEKPMLDAAEGLHRGYAEETAAVALADGTTRRAQLYRATAIDPSLRPYDWYRALVVAGAREHGLPDEYVRALEQVEAGADPDADRTALHVALIDRALIERSRIRAEEEST